MPIVLALLAAMAASCRQALPLVAPPSPSSDVEFEEPGPDDGVVLGSPWGHGVLRCERDGVTVRWQPDGGAPVDVRLGALQSTGGLRLELASAIARVHTASGSIEVFAALDAPVLVVRAADCAPAVGLRAGSREAVAEDERCVLSITDGERAVTAAAVWATTADGLRVAVGFEASDRAAAVTAARAAAERALAEEHEVLAERQRAQWARYWGRSRIDFADPDQQVGYDRARYLRAVGAADAVEAVVGGEAKVVDADAVEAALLREVDGVLEVFPQTSAPFGDVAFTHLRTSGRHLVSARRIGGVVESVAVIAPEPMRLRLRNPFGDRIVFWTDEVRVVDGVCIADLEAGTRLRGNVLLDPARIGATLQQLTGDG